MEQEKSCGAIVFTCIDGQIKFVLAQALDGHYGFPKGHVEIGETEEETALREVFEEVGLCPTLLNGFREMVEYDIPDKDVHKQVVFFLGEYEMQNIQIQEAELQKAPLVSFEDALRLLTHEDSRRILSKAVSFLEKRHSNALLRKFGFTPPKKAAFKKYNMDVRFDSFLYAKMLDRKLNIVPMATEEEIIGKGYVHWKSWHETYAGLVDPAYMERLTLEKCVETAHRWSDNILVAKDGDQVVGFVGFGASQDGTISDCGEVFSIYVLADYHGQQVGYELMNAAMEKLAEYKRIAVWVLKGNERAIRFYERYGFRFDGTEKEIFLGAPNTELRMIYTGK